MCFTGQLPAQQVPSQVMARVSALERALLAEQLATLRAAFLPGLSVVNWNSLGIPEFAAGFRKARVPCRPTPHNAGAVVIVAASDRRYICMLCCTAHELKPPAGYD